jgi:GT2 family glycosyltransferase
VSTRLSVIIPTFGRSDSVARVLDALRVQTWRDFEILVVDQNPPGYLVEQLGAAPLANVRHLCLPEPNASTARNLGFAAACGDLVLFLDDDLVPAPAYLETAVANFDTHAAVGCIASVVYGAGGAAAVLRSVRTLATGRIIAGSTLLEVREVGSGGTFFRREYFRRSGGYDELLFAFARTAEDQELSMRMRRRGLSLWVDSSLCIFHDDHVLGGCELRTSPYWSVRARCINAWAFRYRAHGGRRGALALDDVLRLFRSAALNRAVLKAGARNFAKQVMLLGAALGESRRCIDSHVDLYRDVSSIDHLRRHDSTAQTLIPG